MATRGPGRTGIAAAGALTLGTMLAGCVGNTPIAAPTTPATSSSPAASNTSTPTPDVPTTPARPAAMATNDPKGAAAAAVYFIRDLYPYIYASGDLTDWDALSSADCTFCVGMRAKITDMTAAGERVDPGLVTVSGTQVTEQRAGQWYLVSTRFEQGESSRLDSSGTPIRSTPGGTVDALLALSWDGAWHVDQVDLVPVGG